MAHPFRLYNTLKRATEPFEPLQPGHIGLYVCGMTVYDHCHLGHARAMVTFDAFTRYLRHRGWQVKFVRNFTDVDDKIIARAAEQGIEPAEWAQRFIDDFHADTDALGLDRPTVEPRVSTSIDAIQDLILKLIERGHAYEAQGSVWFDVLSDADYGKLSGIKVDKLRSSDPDRGKRHGADFALWKANKPGEPSWSSPWGPGRPGWHIECSAMCIDTLGPTIDIHGGGTDLVFPHHENEVAQSECGTGQPFARFWMHNGMLTVGSGAKAGGKADREAQQTDALGVDAKMGKSKGNAFQISTALELFPAEAIRLFYLQTHYRSKLPYDDEALVDALAKLARLYDAREVAEGMRGEQPPDDVARSLGTDAMDVLHLGRGLSDKLYSALDDDFNTALALAHAFELARAINRLANNKNAKKRGGPVVEPALRAFGLLNQALGLLGMSSASFQAEVKLKRLEASGVQASAVESLLDERATARSSKDWARADAIRDELDTMGIVVMDKAGGVEWRVRLGSPAE